MTFLMAGTGAYAIYVMWFRRTTWRYGWEVATSVNIVGLTICMLFIPPYVTQLDQPLHLLTGLWNADDLIGLTAYLVGIGALMHTMINRLDWPGRRTFLRRRLRLPAVVVLPVMIGLFAMGDASYPISDFVAEGVRLKLWMDAFWVIFCASAAWIIGHLIWALLIIRHASEYKVVANLYLAALTLDVPCIIMLLVHAIWPPAPAWLAWMFACLASMLYLSAAWWSWHWKLRYFNACNRGLMVAMRNRPRPRRREYILALQRQQQRTA